MSRAPTGCLFPSLVSALRPLRPSSPSFLVNGPAAQPFCRLEAGAGEAVPRAAEQSGLLGEKSCRIAGRVSPTLVAQAKRQTGIETDTDLIEFALATIALEDEFAQAFKQARGTVDPDIELGF
jgi:hypothetical protein